MTRWHKALALSLAAATLACSQPPPEPGIVTVSIRSAPNNLDPRFGTDESSTRSHDLLYNDLLKLDDRMQLAPDLATSWETDDYQTYRIHLRQGVRFHDGHELTSQDVVHTFTSILDPAMSSPYRGAYRLLESVTALDPHTVQFVLKEPSGSFLINLKMKIVPAGAGRELRDHPVGTGPYRFARYLTDDRLEVKAFPDYFEGLPRNRGVTLKVVPDDIMRGLELRKRTTDLVINDLVPDIAYRLEREGLRLITAPGLDYQYIGFNFRDPILKDVRVRRAIGYAIDRDAIITHLRRGLAKPADSMIPETSWAYEPDVFTFHFDPDQARALLDEAGYPDPDGDGPRPRLTLSLKTSTQEFYRLQAAVIQQDLKQVGIELDLRSYEFATLYADILKGSFQMYTLQWVGGAMADPDILKRVFHSQQVPPAGFNRGYFSDPEVDRLLDEASLATDQEARKIRYALVQKRVAELAPYISLWRATTFGVAQPDLRGVRFSPFADFTFFRNVSR
jgi:peptide/nickel transport system substrate-binding protein